MPDSESYGFSPLPGRLDQLGASRWAVHYRAMMRRAAGEDVLILSIGEPDTATPPDIVDEAVAAMRSGRTHYSSAEGEPAFLEALTKVYSNRTGRDITTDQAIFTPGAHTAMYLVCQTILGPGDDLLLPEPYYAAYAPIIAITGARAVPVPLDPANGFHLRGSDLENVNLGGAKALLLNNPHNPTGAVLSESEVRDVAELCAEHGIWIVADEVYEHLVYDGEFASPFDIEAFEPGVAVVSSLSKSHSMTGWRTGWALGSPDLISRVHKVAEAVMFGMQPFLQDAAAYALLSEHEVSRQMCDDYRRRAEMVVEALGSVPGIRCHPPEAGIFIMLDISGTGLSGTEFATRLLDEHDVGTMPGESFGASGAGYLRVSLTVDDDVLSEACRRIEEFARGL